uniref:Radical SAM core domain-containing protein n=1 Tax=Timspurckia oligopyrenoides TaxID=708627 RepID=A0A7S0ZJD0_9RHOD|mmetsp:Transcript_7605/g.13781  ORF Transcript_7605/g.13781 Transcript_7605/m.13781 type:complete len:461 (+) Transcript_7605:31-1413(+)
MLELLKYRGIQRVYTQKRLITSFISDKYEKENELQRILETSSRNQISKPIQSLLGSICSGGSSKALEPVENVVELLQSKTDLEHRAIRLAADLFRIEQCGNIVSYVVNRNINYTNVCVKRCGFCAFSRTLRKSEEGYLLPLEEIVRRAQEAADLGATEVCIQAGLLPNVDPNQQVSILQSIKQVLPDIHVHAYSPEEVLFGAKARKVSIREHLSSLIDAGLGSMPGTSAEILNQELRNRISPGRISVKNWLEVIRTAHELGIPTTSTMMYGHVEEPYHVAEHLLLIRKVQRETKGFTEFVPLSFVHSEAPMFRSSQGVVKPGPSFDQRLTIHAISRLVLGTDIRNIQASWVKEGKNGALQLLDCGVNDLGGTLINESISTAAGSQHGQLLSPTDLRAIARQAGRQPRQRSTVYKTIRDFPLHPDPNTKESDPLNSVDPSQFGSFHELISNKKFKYDANSS